jgi:hypothetical protein
MTRPVCGYDIRQADGSQYIWQCRTSGLIG